MFGFEYVKVPPTTYVMHYAGGKAKRQGAGLSFWYWAPAATIVQIPLASMTQPFAFLDVSSDFQGVTLQGQVTYRVAEPAKLAERLDFSVKPNGMYRTEDSLRMKE